MGTKAPGSRGSTLTQAASLIFALVAVIPLLLFLYSLYTLDALATTRYQVILAAALGVALFGLCILRLMVSRVSALIRAMPRPIPGVRETEPGSGEAGGGTEGEADPRAVWVLGLGPLHELGEMNEILERMWRAQVWPHVGRPVRVSLRDAQGSLAGMLAQVTPHSLVLEADGRQETIDFTQISGIEPVRAMPANR